MASRLISIGLVDGRR